MSPAVRRLVPYVLRYRRAFVFGLASALATTAVSLLSPWVLRHAIDDLTAGVTTRKLGYYAGLILLIALIGGIFRFYMRRTIVGASRLMEYDLRNDFFRKLQTLDLQYFQARRTGDLMSRATNDLNAVRMMIGPAVMYTTTTVVLFIVAIVLMLSLNVKLTVVSLMALPLVSVSVRYFGQAIHDRFEQIQAQLSDISAVVQENLSGVRVVRAYGQEDAEIERFNRANEEYVARNRALIRLQGLFFPSMTFFLGVASLLVLWLGSREVILGRLTVGEFVAFNAYLAMLSWPMIAFGWVTNMLQRGMASWKRMLEVLEAEPTVRDAEVSPLAPRSPHDVRGAIELRNLTLAFGDTVLLRNISVRIEPGQTVALVGPTGSGKSTLLSLLPRLHEPPPGTVFVDGVDVRQIPLAVLRGAIGFVPQEPFLFSDRLADNVAFGIDASAGGAGRAGGAGQAGQAGRPGKDVDQFPAGYATTIGERGITLSGGQKQRTAIARAIITDPRILILDDALSAVDTYTEEEILARLRGVMRQRTSLIVSHRISTVRDADLILVLDRGRIIERGTHVELVSRGGFYADLHRKQLLEDELAAS